MKTRVRGAWGPLAWWLVMWALSVPAAAAPARKPAPQPAAAAAAPEPAPAPALATEGRSTEALVKAAAEACDGLDYESCIQFGQAALARPDVTDTQKEQAYALLGGGFAIVGQGMEADRYFRLLLRLRPDQDLPADTPPKILGAFRRVQAEENQIRSEVKEAARRKLIKNMDISVTAPARHAGGTPLTVAAAVSDPGNGVDQLVLEYRQGSSGAFSTVPFSGSGAARQVVFSAAQTAADHPYRLEFLVVAKDRDGAVLLQQGTPEQPRVVDVAAGQVPGTPLWQHAQFWVVAAGAGGAAVAGAVVMAAVVGVGVSLASAALFLAIRGDGVQQTSAGEHRVSTR